MSGPYLPTGPCPHGVINDVCERCTRRYFKRYSGNRLQRLVKLIGRLIWPSWWNMDQPRPSRRD